MRVKTRIVFEVEYPLSLEFYETDDKHKALEMERACVAGDPVGIMDAFGARGDGTFTTSVEVVDLEPGRKPLLLQWKLSPPEIGEVKWLLKSGWHYEAIAGKLKIPVSEVYAIERAE